MAKVNENFIDLYHGSQVVVDVPLLAKGSYTNDYGQGFYCTQEIELAKEWAASENLDGYANHYQLDLRGLRILNLKDVNPLEWIALLVNNRKVRLSTSRQRKAKEWLLANYLPDISDADLIIGYRADDSYFAYVRAFLNGILSVDQLEMAMKLGKLGEQYVLKSNRAFLNIKFLDAIKIDGEHYYEKRLERNRIAQSDFEKLTEEPDDSPTIVDLMKGKM